MPTKIQELIMQKELIEKAILEEKERQKVEGIEKVKAIMEEYALDLSDIFPQYQGKAKGNKASVKKVAPKYRHPETGETWTGRGKEPSWIAGRDRNLYLI